MISRTSREIQGDVLELLQNSCVSSAISGEVYREGLRPKDSKLEDAIVVFTTGLVDEIQTGVITINIYTPDIDPYSDGVYVEDGQRCEELEKISAEWVASLTAEKTRYKFSLQQTIYTEEALEIRQHFVVIKLNYKFLTH